MVQVSSVEFHAVFMNGNPFQESQLGLKKTKWQVAPLLPRR